MTKAQIKAELRRSALEDDHPWYECQEEAFGVAFYLREESGHWFPDLIAIRTFFLLIAESL